MQVLNVRAKRQLEAESKLCSDSEIRSSNDCRDTFRNESDRSSFSLSLDEHENDLVCVT